MGVVTASDGLVSTSYVDADQIAGALVPGTSHLLVVRDSSSLELRDVASNDVIATAPFPLDGLAAGGVPVVSADGARAVMIAYDPSADRFHGGLAVIDTTTLDPVGAVIPLDEWPQDVAIDPSGDTVAAVFRGDGSITAIDVASGASQRSGPFITEEDVPESTPSASLAFDADGRILLGTVLPELLFLDPSSLAVEARVPITPFSANIATVLTADGRVVASGERSTVAIDSGSASMLWSHSLEVTKPESCIELAASSARGTLYCADPWGGIVEYSLESGMPTSRRFDPQWGRTGSLGLTDDGGRLVAIASEMPALSLWRTDGGGAVSALEAAGRVMLDGYGGTEAALVVAERPPEARIDIDLSDFSLWVPDGDRTLRQLGDLEGTGWAGRDLLMAFSPAEEDFVTIVGSTGERIVSSHIPEASMRFLPGPSGERSYMMNYAGARSDDDVPRGWVAVYDGATGNPTGLTLELGESMPWYVSASADDSVVAITRLTSEGFLTGLYDGRTGAQIIDGLEGPTVTAITPSGELLAAEDGRITRHDLKTLAKTGTIPGARGEINSLQVSRDGRTLLATANDETVTLYDLPSGIRLGDPIPASAPLIGQGALRPDGLQFVVNVKDGIQVWDADPEHQFAAACRIAGRVLTAEERATYLDLLPEQPDACAAVLG